MGGYSGNAGMTTSEVGRGNTPIQMRAELAIKRVSRSRPRWRGRIRRGKSLIISPSPAAAPHGHLTAKATDSPSSWPYLAICTLTIMAGQGFQFL